MRTGMLARELERRGHQVTWWCSTFSHPGRTLVYQQDHKTTVGPGLTLMAVHAGEYNNNVSVERYRHHRRLAERFARLSVEEPTPDVIIVGFPIPDVALAAVRYARSQQIPCIVDVQDLWPEVFVERVNRHFQRLARTILRPWFRTAAAVFQGADQVVACSQGYLNWALTLAGREPSIGERVFHFGYSSHDQPAFAVTSHQLDALKDRIAGKIVFTYIGSFGYAYDLSLVCTVARNIARLDHPSIHFVLAGGGQRFDQLAEAVRSMGNVTLTGWLNAAEMNALLRISDVGLVPRCGTPNNVPNKPFEYMAAGLPILSSLEGEMVDIIEQNKIGFSYRSGDEEALSSLVLRLARDPALRKKQGANARELFFREFEASVVYEKYSRFIESVVQGQAA